MWSSCKSVSKENENLCLHFSSGVVRKKRINHFSCDLNSPKLWNALHLLGMRLQLSSFFLLIHIRGKMQTRTGVYIHYVRNYGMGHILSICKMLNTFAALIKYWRIVLGSLMIDFGKAKMAEANFPIALYKEGQSKSS